MGSSVKSSNSSSSGSSHSDSITLRMSAKRTFGAALRSSPSLRWNSSRCSSGTRPTSRKEATCPIFIAAPFMVPSASTICSAASKLRCSSARRRPSSLRATFAARVPAWRAACPAASPPSFAVRRRREVGILSFAIGPRVMVRAGGAPGWREPRPAAGLPGRSWRAYADRVDEHRALQVEALNAEGEAQRALMSGEDARAEFTRAAGLYRASWDAAPPDAWGRLVGYVKAAVLANDAGEAARFTLTTVGAEPTSPTAASAAALALLVTEQDGSVPAAAALMRTGGGGFVAAADAVEGLARRDDDAYETALQAIVTDFEGRERFVAKVPIADTAVVLERLADDRGMAVRPTSP